MQSMLLPKEATAHVAKYNGNVAYILFQQNIHVACLLHDGKCVCKGRGEGGGGKINPYTPTLVND